MYKRQTGSIIRTFLIMTALYVAMGLVLFFLSAMLYIWPIGIIAGIILTIVYIIIFIKDLVYLDKIMVGSKAAAEGKLNYKIDEKGRGHLRELAHDINNMRDGLKTVSYTHLAVYKRQVHTVYLQEAKFKFRLLGKFE